MNKIKISLIVPVYNGEKYIKRCVCSLLNQTLKEIEIIIINDGSIDNTIKILKDYVYDNRIIIITQKNQGVSSSRNKGLEISRGEYILNIDSDDWIEKNYCEEMYKKAKKNDLDILVSDFYLNFEGNEKNHYFKDLLIDDEKILSGEEYMEIFFKENFNGYNWNKLIKRKLYKKMRITYDMKINMMEDVLVLVQLLKFSKRIGKINNSYYHYVRHFNNTTSNLNESHLIEIQNVFFKIENIVDFKMKKICFDREKCEVLKKILSVKIQDKRKFEKSIDLFFKDLELFSGKILKKNKIINYIILFLKKYKSKHIIYLLRKINLIKNFIKNIIKRNTMKGKK